MTMTKTIFFEKENKMQALKEKQEPSVDLDKVDLEEMKRRYKKYSDLIIGLNKAIDKMKVQGGSKA